VTVDLGKFPHSAASIKQQHSITRTSVCWTGFWVLDIFDQSGW
jgi:hypothetical protein